MKLPLLVFTLAFAAACSFEPTTCVEAGCDPQSQFCRFFGSDTLAPATVSCSDIPDACAATATCDCLLEEEDPIATCTTEGELLIVTIPGG